jgi:hypothetical protein
MKPMNAFERGFHLGIFAGIAAAAIGFVAGWIAYGALSPSHRRADDRTAAETKPRIPAAIEIAIDEQHGALGTAISILYCLHSTTLCYQVAGAGRFESEDVEDAAEWAELTDITSMLLVRLNGIHIALDCTELGAGGR